jgi:enoyl-[acyl-carrier protein] reductase III
MNSDEGVRTRLEGRVAVVTGSSRGLGAATVRRLAALGATPVITFRKEEQAAEKVAAEIREKGSECWVRHLDMGDVESIGSLFSWLESADGPGGIDILVANAAASSWKPLLDQRPHNVERTFAISVTGFLEATRLAVPIMQARGGGRIVAVSGLDTRGWGPGHGLLAAAKASMEIMVQYLQVELGGTGVTAIAANLDGFRSKGIEIGLGAKYEQMVRIMDATHPFGAMADVDDMAEVVALCCTDAATWLGGSIVQADGGHLFSKSGRFLDVAQALSEDALEQLLKALSPDD